MNKTLDTEHTLRAKRVWGVRQLTQLSRREFSKRYGIAAGTLQNWEDAHGNGLSEKGAYRLVNSLQTDGIFCTPQWLLHGVGDAPRVTDLMPAIALVMDSHATVDVEQAAIAAELQLFCTHYPDAIFMHIKDDSMVSQYNSGDYVAGVRYYENAMQNFIGKDCIVMLNTGEQLLRRLRFSNIPGLFDLFAINPQTTATKPYYYDVSLVYVAPIMWHRRCMSTL
jgi:hypothetical protein